MSGNFYAHLKVGASDVAVPASSIVQALDSPVAGLVPLPRREGPQAGALAGMIHCQHGVVPVVSLGRWVPLGRADEPHDRRIVMLRSGRSLIGIEVDALLGLKQIASSAIRTVCHDGDAEALFEAVAPATVERPLLCLLEVERLMKLAAVWCEAAELEPGRLDLAAETGTDVAQRPAESVRHVLFTIGEQLWALPALAVAKLAKTPRAELRLAGQRVCGIGTWEGRKLPLLDLAHQHDGAGDTRPWMAVVSDGQQAIGLLVDSCDQLVNLVTDGIIPTPDDELRVGTTLVRGRGNASVLDIARLFSAVPEATISRMTAKDEHVRKAPPVDLGARSSANAANGTVEQSDGYGYLVFEADRSYATPATGLIGVVPLSDTATAELSQGRRSTVHWRGQTLGVVNMPQIDGGKAVFDAQMAVVVTAPGNGDRQSAIAVRSLTRWLPARLAPRSRMRMHSVGEVSVITLAGQRRSESLVVVDLAEMAFLID